MYFSVIGDFFYYCYLRRKNFTFKMVQKINIFALKYIFFKYCSCITKHRRDTNLVIMLDSNRNVCALWAYFGNKKEFESVMFMGAESSCEVPGQGRCLTAVSFERLWVWQWQNNFYVFIKSNLKCSQFIFIFSEVLLTL